MKYVYVCVKYINIKSENVQMPPTIKIDKTCTECREEKGKYITAFSIYLCDVCKPLAKYTLITKTNAKKTYLLHDDDLVALHGIERNSSYGPATYYTKEDIKNMVCRKYNIAYDSVDEHIRRLIAEKEEQKQNRKIRLAEKKENALQKRKENLVVALAEYKLELRADSMLCQKYIDGTDEFDINYVVRRMCQMRYLFDYCHMDECREEAYQQHMEELEAGYFPDSSVFEAAEELALRKYSNGEYPWIYPWMEDEFRKRKTNTNA